MESIYFDVLFVFSCRALGRMNEIEEAWNERNPDAAFTSPVASQLDDDDDDDDDDNYSSRYNTQDSQSIHRSQDSVIGYDGDDYTAATTDYSQDFSQDDAYGVEEVESKEKRLERLKAEATSSSLGKVADSNTLPIIIKSSAYTKSMLLCECTDTDVNFDGDTGAIGRMVADSNNRSLIFDLKGRQYRGKLRKGPTVLILNTAPAVGAKPDDKEPPARAECVINEFCNLRFEKDLLSDLKGNYTGLYDLADELINEVPLDRYGKAAEKKKASAAAKKKRKGNDDDDDDDDYEDDNDESKLKKKAPKISAGRTQAMKGKDGKKKRKSVSKKKAKKK